VVKGSSKELVGSSESWWGIRELVGVIQELVGVLVLKIKDKKKETHFVRQGSCFWCCCC